MYNIIKNYSEYITTKVLKCKELSPNIFSIRYLLFFVERRSKVLTHDVYSMSDPVTSVRETGSLHVLRKYMISIYRENMFGIR
jgi:hypothetical protein